MIQIVMSDLHLGSRACRVRDVLDILQSPADRFILNGDIVNSVNFKKFRKLDWHALDRIRQLANVGRAVLIQGNHDAHLAAATGMDVLPSTTIINPSGDWYVVHGDFFDPTLNWPLVTDVAEWCYQTAQAVHKNSARLAKKLFKRYGGIVQIVQHRAVQFAKHHEYAGIITGHTHFAEDAWINGVRYLNCGSWTETPCHYVEITDSGISLKQW